jgi:cytochrome c peroxidase
LPEGVTGNHPHKSLQKTLHDAQVYLLTHTDFNAFDRMHFISRYANPLSAQLLSFQQSSGYQPLNELRALRGDAATLFDKNAFNADFFAPGPDAYITPAKIKLGQMLFYDPLLSSDNSRSCATCHKPEKAFTDGLAASAAFVKGKFVKRNAPTLLNAALQHNQFYDSRSTTLEHQAIEVVENEEEMHGSLTEAIKKLHRQAEYVNAFKNAFENMNDSIRPMHIQNAIASYVRSLVSLNSRFDEYMRGDESQLTQEEVKGFNVFMGKAKCGTCHFMPLFNGTVPPAFANTESEVLGVPARNNTRQVDGDLGKFAVYSFEQFKYAFKTPTVRNAELTAPYMHNGVYQTLAEVVDFYDNGGGAGLGIDLPNQTLSADALHLADDEKKALVAFMKSLTDIPVDQQPAQ